MARLVSSRFVWLAPVLVIVALVGFEAIFRLYEPPSLPVLDWIRPQSLDLRRSYMLGVLLVLMSFRGAWDVRGWRRFVLRITGTGGCMLVLVSMLMVQDFHVNYLAEGSDGARVAVLENGNLVDMEWRSDLMHGSPVLLMPRIVGNEWVLARIARGMYQEQDLMALGRGDMEHSTANRFSAVRAVLWRVQQSMILLMLSLRVLLLPGFLWLAWTFIRGSGPGMPMRRLTTAALFSLSLAIPVVNLALHAAIFAANLPEAGSNGHRSLLLSCLFLVVALAADLAGRLFRAPRIAVDGQSLHPEVCGE